jgi:DNA modification methylase
MHWGRTATERRRLSLRFEEVALDDLTDWEDNPRINEDAVPRVAALIKQHGFAGTVVATPDGVLRAGHTRCAALRTLGIDRVWVNWMNFASVEAAEDYAIADNKSGEFAEWDREKLARLFKKRVDADLKSIADATGFNKREIELLRAKRDVMDRIYKNKANGVGQVDLHCGEVEKVLKGLPDGIVQCVVTSPPYWSLRDYGVSEWIGGSSKCSHVPDERLKQARTSNLAGTTTQGMAKIFRKVCGKCGAKRKPFQIGLEPTFAEFVENIVRVFRELRRVLRDDGVVWLNMGDSFATSTTEGFKAKDLIGQPWRLAIALQEDGWYLRSDVVWSKPNPTPEPVTDRPTKAHEFIFLLTKSPKYFYDADAVRVKTGGEADPRNYGGKGWHDHKDDIGGGQSQPKPNMAAVTHPMGRNLWDVWHVAKGSFPGAHFASFPEKLIEPCIHAGAAHAGGCAVCGRPLVRVLQDVNPKSKSSGRGAKQARSAAADGRLSIQPPSIKNDEFRVMETVGWKKACKCETKKGVPDRRPCIVMDPFSGTGTAGVVAIKHGCSYIGIDVSKKYLLMSAKRFACKVRFHGMPIAKRRAQ